MSYSIAQIVRIKAKANILTNDYKKKLLISMRSSSYINYLRNDVSKRLLLASKLAVSGLKLD